MGDSGIKINESSNKNFGTNNYETNFNTNAPISSATN
jgi:hypothetical protein